MAEFQTVFERVDWSIGLVSDVIDLPPNSVRRKSQTGNRSAWTYQCPLLISLQARIKRESNADRGEGGGALTSAGHLHPL